MTKFSAVSENKIEQERKIILSVLPSTQYTQSEERLSELPLLIIHRVNDSITETTRMINERISATIPSLRLLIRKVPGSMRSKDVLIDDESVVRKAIVRIFLYPDEKCEADIYSENSIMDKFDISHLVTIKLSNNVGKWSNSVDSNGVDIAVTQKDMELLLHDIMIDIAMFYGCRSIADIYGNDLESKKLFSATKVEFAVANGLINHYGQYPIDLSYIPLSSFCRDRSCPTEFKRDRLEELWLNLIEFVQLKQQSSDMTPESNKILSPIEYIFNCHRHKGELSRKRLGRDVRNLEKGVYLLMTTNKRPKRKDVRNNILNVLGRKMWRSRMHKIIRFEDYVKYRQYFPFFTFFKFEV